MIPAQLVTLRLHTRIENAAAQGEYEALAYQDKVEKNGFGIRSNQLVQEFKHVGRHDSGDFRAKNIGQQDAAPGDADKKHHAGCDHSSQQASQKRDPKRAFFARGCNVHKTRLSNKLLAYQSVRVIVSYIDMILT